MPRGENQTIKEQKGGVSGTLEKRRHIHVIFEKNEFREKRRGFKQKRATVRTAGASVNQEKRRDNIGEIVVDCLSGLAD